MELNTVLSLLLCLTLGMSQDRPTAAQVEQAHQLLNGEWDIVSLTDDGETLGRELIRAKLAENGVVGQFEICFLSARDLSRGVVSSY